MTLTPKSDHQTTSDTLPSPLRCIGGGVVAGTIAIGFYFVTISIATTFAAKPIISDNFTIRNISSAVRTLVVGSTALGATVFGIAAIGLIALGIKILLQQFKKA